MTDMVTLIGYAGGTLTTIAFLPQVIQTWRSRSCTDLSYGMLVIFASGILLWFLYGIGIGSAPVMIANGLTLILVLIIAYLKIRFG
jgi:MtN3 and saliva related transmembrane protein